MQCELVRAKLSNYADDDVGFRDRVAIDVHVARCAACHDELASLRETLEACRLSLSHPNPRDRFDELMAYIRTRERARGIVRRIRVRRPRPVISQVAAAAAVIAILGLTAPFARGAKRLTEGIDRSPDAPMQTAAQAPLVSRDFVKRRAKIVTACRWSEEQQAPADPGDAAPFA